MPSRHKSPLLGWHPPPELAEWVRGEAELRGVTITVILNEAVSEKRLPSAVQEWLREQAEREGRSMTAIVIEALEAYRLARES